MIGWLAALAMIGGAVWPVGEVAAQACTGICAQLPLGAISWWPLDSDGSDIIGGNSGTPAGVGGTFQVGEVCSAFKSGGFTGRIRVPHAASLNVTTFTVEGWVRLDSPLNFFNEPVVWKGNLSGTNITTSFALGTTGTIGGSNPPGTVFGLISNGVGWQVVYATSPLVFGAFTHVALTASGSNLCLYVNGVMQSCPSQTLTPQATVNDLVIGALNNPSNRWNGLIDELTLYNRALQPKEILLIHGAGNAGKCRCTGLAHQLQQQLAAANATIAAQQAEIGSLQSQLNTGRVPLDLEK
jgi:hypothetical protein